MSPPYFSIYSSDFVLVKLTSLYRGGYSSREEVIVYDMIYSINRFPEGIHFLGTSYPQVCGICSLPVHNKL